MTWYFLPQYVPADGQTVWCRRDQFSTVPFQAVWDLSAQTFTSVDNSIEYPAWIITKWRAL